MASLHFQVESARTLNFVKMGEEQGKRIKKRKVMVVVVMLVVCADGGVWLRRRWWWWWLQENMATYNAVPPASA